MSGEPYPMPEKILGSRGPVTFRLSSIPGGGLEKSRPGSLPGTATAADKHLGQGYANLFLLLREERGMIFQGTLERQEPSGKAWEGVAGVFHLHELLAPGGGFGGDTAAKSRLQVFIGCWTVGGTRRTGWPMAQ